MRGPRHPGRRISVSGSVLVVTLASGMLFAVSAATTRDHSVHADADVVTLVRAQQQTVESMESENAALRDQVRTALDGVQSGESGAAPPSSSSAPTPTPTPTPPGGVPQDPATPPVDLAGSAVSGPGVTVTLTDAPAGSAAADVDPDLLVVHQQDIEDVINALWSGGAEAMTVQDARITAGTVVRCIGNVILIDGTSYSPPYRIAAIGDPDRLQDALDADPLIQIYKQYVARFGLGWSAKSSDQLDFAAPTQEQPVRDAQVMEDHG